MIRRLLVAALALASLFLLGACNLLVQKWFLHTVEPEQAFYRLPTPAAPDYSKPESWAALPDRVDNADVVPDADVSDGQATAQVDCFFVHPTTHVDGRYWNQPPDLASASEGVDNRVLPSQASAFNAACRVFAPRYRQANIYAFYQGSDRGDPALELAYSDVKRAFRHFLEHHNNGRPFILAGHSQGAYHGLQLLEELISGTALRQRMVAVYLIGWNITDDELRYLPDTPVCGAPQQTGCLVSWNSEGPDPKLGLADLTEPTTVCVNPLSWRSDGVAVERSRNLGGFVYKVDGTSPPPPPDPGIADARCVEGALKVTPLKDERYENGPLLDGIMGEQVYHIFDISLFYMNLRQNVAERIEVYLAGQRGG